MNIESIAKKLKTSPSTVSRALRNCDGVHPKTRKKVLRYANEIGYLIPETKETHGVALLLPGGDSVGDVHELASRYMITIGDEVMKLGWQLYIVAIPLMDASMLNDKDKWPETLKNDKIDCCIIVDMVPAKARKLLAEHFKNNVVMISRYYLEDGISGVAISDYNSGRFAVSKLVECNHSNIGWIGSLGSEDISRQRYSGVVSELLCNDIKLNAEVWLDERKPLEDELETKMIEVLSKDKSDWPTAWIASTDWLGAKVLLWLESQGLKCPEDFKLICFDNTKIAETLAQRKLSTIISPAVKIAKAAVNLLANRWKKKSPSPTGWIYPVDYQEGATFSDEN